MDRWTGRTGRVPEFVLAAIAALAAAAISVMALRAWRIDWSVPLGYSTDALLHLGYVQNMLESGWYLDGQRLGAPFGQDHHDYPLGPDNLHLLIVRALTAVTGDAPASVNAFYLLTFPLVALACFWVFRRLRVPGAVAVAGAVLFAVLPYHFIRGPAHLFLAAYYTVPLSCFVIVATLDGRRFFGLGGRWRRRSRAGRIADIAVPVLLALLIASGGAYYAAFTLALLAVATGVGALRTRSTKLLASGALLMTLIAGFLALNSGPTFLYWAEHGMNADVPARDELETERHALRPVALLLPVEGHRLAPLATLTERYAAFPTTGERGESLGTVGAVGLVVLLGVAAAALGGAAGRRKWSRHRRLAVLTVTALAFGVVGGLSTLIALVVTAQVRAWSRLSIFIAFFCLLAVCLVLAEAWRRARASRWRPVAGAALAAFVAVASLDQTTNDFIPAYQVVRSEFMADRQFVQQVEAALPSGAAIYQLPYRPYLEGGPRAESPDYDPLRPYLHSQALRWSYGAMKGREAGWQHYAHGRAIDSALPIVGLAGFSAVWVDRAAYAEPPRALEAQLAMRADATPLVSPGGRHAVYDLTAYAQALRRTVGDETWAALQRRLLAPVWPRWREGAARAWPDDEPETGQVSRGLGGRATLGLLNAGDAGREVVVSFTLATAHGPPATVVVTWPDGSVDTLSTTADALPVARTVVLPAGESLVRLATDAPPIAAFGGRQVLRMRVGDLWVMDTALLDLPEAPTGETSESARIAR